MSTVADKSRAVAHYTQLAAQASALLPSSWAGLSGNRPLIADESRRHGKRCVVTISYKQTVWTARIESDCDGDWWIEAIQVDGQWLDALEVFSLMFLDDLEHAHRSAAE